MQYTSKEATIRDAMGPARLLGQTVRFGETVSAKCEDIKHPSLAFLVDTDWIALKFFEMVLIEEIT